MGGCQHVCGLGQDESPLLTTQTYTCGRFGGGSGSGGALGSGGPPKAVTLLSSSRSITGMSEASSITDYGDGDGSEDSGGDSPRSEITPRWLWHAAFECFVVASALSVPRCSILSCSHPHALQLLLLST